MRRHAPPTPLCSHQATPCCWRLTFVCCLQVADHLAEHEDEAASLEARLRSVAGRWGPLHWVPRALAVACLHTALLRASCMTERQVLGACQCVAAQRPSLPKAL